MDIVERLLEDALSHDDVATQCDCAPEHTVNHQHALNAREAASEIARLRDTLEEITNGVYAAPERLREIAALALKVVRRGKVEYG